MPHFPGAPLLSEGGAQPLARLSQKTYGSSRGIAFVLKDARIPTVDATVLPARLGATTSAGGDLACEVASDVLIVEPAMSDRTARPAGPSGAVREMIAAGRPLACRFVSGRAAE